MYMFIKNVDPRFFHAHVFLIHVRNHDLPKFQPLQNRIRKDISFSFKKNSYYIILHNSSILLAWRSKGKTSSHVPRFYTDRFTYVRKESLHAPFPRVEEFPGGGVSRAQALKFPSGSAEVHRLEYPISQPSLQSFDFRVALRVHFTYAWNERIEVGLEYNPLVNS